MIDTFSLLQKYTGISKYSQSEVITPQNIVSDMVDLLPQEVFNPDATFFDPDAGEDKAWYPDDYEDVPTEATKPGDVETISGKDFSGLGYGISG